MERLGDASWEGPSGWQEWVGVKGESEGEGREGERRRVGGRESWVQWEGEGVGGGEGVEPAPGTQRQAPRKPCRYP